MNEHLSTHPPSYSCVMMRTVVTWSYLLAGRSVKGQAEYVWLKSNQIDFLKGFACLHFRVDTIDLLVDLALGKLRSVH